MEQSQKGMIIKTLKKLNFVNWDRYFEYDGGASFFGWINREKDNYEDFVLIDFVGKEINFATSSKRYSKKIADILNQEHSDCLRVEYFCDLPNVIKLEQEVQQTKGPLEISDETKKVVEQARKPEFTEQEMDDAQRHIEEIEGGE